MISILNLKLRNEKSPQEGGGKNEKPYILLKMIS